MIGVQVGARLRTTGWRQLRRAVCSPGRGHGRAVEHGGVRDARAARVRMGV